MHRASLNESAAAGILHMSGWHQLCKQEGAGAGVGCVDACVCVDAWV